MVKKQAKKAAGATSSSVLAAGTAGGSKSSAVEFANSLNTTLENYQKQLTPKIILIDSFLVFLVLLGVIQFVFCLLIGNFPFNAFLSGFIAAVGQFVLTVSLRLQYVEDNRKIFPSVTPERAIGDYIFASLILHFIVYHFIN